MQPINPNDSVDQTWAAVMERLRLATSGELEIIRELGRGGMAAVFLAEERALNRRVAIKVMSPALLLSPGMVGRFREEAITVAKLNHPNIITIHAVRQVEDLHFFVMNYVEGRSLEAVLGEVCALSVPVARAIVAQIGHALEYAHRCGVVHRDVKPGNLLLDLQGNAIVTDFGIAKVVESSGYTQTGLVIGTLAYMSPEQLEGGKLTGASDQYSLGIVLYEMLAGRPPFGGSTPAIIQGHLREAVPPLRPVRPDCPPELESALFRMLEKNPANRWPSVAEALQALEAILLPPSHFTHAQLAALGAGANAISLRSTPATTLTILDAPDSVPVGRTTTLVAALGDGNPAIERPRVAWVSDNMAVAAVDERGQLRAVSEGVAIISALAGGTHTAIRVRVVPGATDRRGGDGTTGPDRPGRRFRASRHRGRRALRGPALVAAALLIVATGAAWLWSRPSQSTASGQLPVAPTGSALLPPAEMVAAQADVEEERAAPVERPAPAGRAGQTTAEVPASGAPPPDPAAPARSAEEEVREVVDRFLVSLPSSDAGRVRRLYPDLRGDEAWWRFVTERSGDSLRIQYQEMHRDYPLMVDDTTARVQFDVTFAYGAGQIRPWMLSALVVRRGGTWSLSDVRYHQ